MPGNVSTVQTTTTQTLRVLIVDDEPAVRATLILASKKQSWQVEAVESAEDALEKTKQMSFDVAVVDKNLPGMTGVDFVREIRKTNQSLGIIMITGFASADSALETLHLGIDSYLEKPFDNIFDVIKKIEQVAVARQDQDADQSSASAATHFQKAIEALGGGNKKSHPVLHVLLISPVDAERDWIVKQFGDASTVTGVATSQQALKLVQTDPPELVLVDTAVQNPDLLETLQTIKNIVPKVGLVVLAEKKPPLSMITPLIDLGVRIILEKPLNAETFRSKLEYAAWEVGSGPHPFQWSKGHS